MTKIINLSPSIPNLSKESLKVSGNQISYFRTKEFTKLLKECESKILKLTNCNGRVIFFNSSGTGAMDSVVCNLIKKTDRALVINGGDFGQRWVDICKFYNLKVKEFKVIFGKDIFFPRLQDMIKEFKPNILLVQHVETSSGQKHNIKIIAKLCKRYHIKLFVDSISSFLSEYYNMDKWGIDVSITSSQKGLGLFPGVSIVVLNKKILKEKANERSFYFSYQKYLSNEWLSPFTPNVPVLLQLNNKLKNINLKKEIQKREEMSSYFRSLIKNLPVKIITQTPSNSVTVLYVEKDVYDFFEKMCKKNIYFSPRNKNIMVISHMGNIKKEDYNLFVKEVKKWT